MAEDYAAAGFEVRSRLLGARAVRAPRDDGDAAAFVGEISDEANWGRIWARPGLDVRTRVLCVIVALSVQDQWEYVRVHVAGARNIGVPREELVELAGQLIFYATLARCHRLIKIVDDVFEDPGAA